MEEMKGANLPALEQLCQKYAAVGATARAPAAQSTAKALATVQVPAADDSAAIGADAEKLAFEAETCEGEKVAISVRSTSGKTVSYDVATSVTGQQLKGVVAKEGTFEVAVSEFRLIFLGKILEDGKTLAESGVTKPTTLILAGGGAKAGEAKAVAPVSLNKSVARLQQTAPAASATALKTMLKLLENISANPGEAKFRKIKKSNKAFATRIGAVPAAVECLKSAGFLDAGAEEFVYNPAAEPMLSAALELLRQVTAAPTPAAAAAPAASPFAAPAAPSPFGAPAANPFGAPAAANPFGVPAAADPFAGMGAGMPGVAGMGESNLLLRLSQHLISGTLLTMVALLVVHRRRDAGSGSDGGYDAESSGAGNDATNGNQPGAGAAGNGDDAAEPSNDATDDTEPADDATSPADDARRRHGWIGRYGRGHGRACSSSRQPVCGAAGWSVCGARGACSGRWRSNDPSGTGGTGAVCLR